MDDVNVVDAVPGVDDEFFALRELGSVDQAGEFGFLSFAEGVSEGAGVEFDHFGAQLSGRFDLAMLGVNEKADADAGGLQSLDGGFEGAAMFDAVEAPFRGDFLAVFGDEADVVGLDAKGEVEDFLGVAHFEVELRHEAVAELANVLVLDVAAVGAEVDGNAMCPGAFASGSSFEEARLRIGMREHGGIAGLPKGGHVVDVDAEFHGKSSVAQNGEDIRKKFADVSVFASFDRNCWLERSRRGQFMINFPAKVRQDG